MDFRRAYARIAAPSNFATPHLSADLFVKVRESSPDASIVSVAPNPFVIKIAKRKDMVVTVEVDAASGNAVVFANDNRQQAMVVSAGMTIPASRGGDGRQGVLARRRPARGRRGGVAVLVGGRRAGRRRGDDRSDRPPDTLGMRARVHACARMVR